MRVLKSMPLIKRRFLWKYHQLAYDYREQRWVEHTSKFL